MSVLSVKNLRKTFYKGFFPKKQEVLKGVCFEVPEGKITGFLGANGSGKTTSMKAILDLISYDSGEISFFGGKKLDQNLRNQIGFLPEHPSFYSYLTGYEFLEFYGGLSFIKKKDLKERINFLLKKVDLSAHQHKKIKDYSKGMLQKIGIVQALIHRPKLMILDEPLSGLDPDGRHAVREAILEASKQEGVSVFFSSHLLDDIEKICSHLVILKQGLIFYEGLLSGFLDSLSKSSYLISYFEKGTKKIKKLNSLEQLQKEIDSLRIKNFQISSITKDQVSLEEGFVKEVLKT